MCSGGGSVGGDTFSAASGANAARVEIENNGMGCSAKTCPNSLGDDLMRGGGMGGGTAGGAAGAGLGVIIGEMLGGDDNKQSQPNVGKDLSDADKAEYGGAGSGTPVAGGQKMRKKGVMMSRIVENTRMIRYGLKQERMTLFQTPTAIGISIKLNSQNLKIRSNTLMLHMILSETLQKEH